MPGEDTGALDFYRRANRDKKQMATALAEHFKQNEGGLDDMLKELKGVVGLVKKNGKLEKSNPSSSQVSQPEAIPLAKQLSTENNYGQGPFARQSKMNDALEKLKLWYSGKYKDDLKILEQDVRKGVVIEDKRDFNKLEGTHRFRLSNKGGYDSENTKMLKALGFELIADTKDKERLVLKWKEPAQGSEQSMDQRSMQQLKMERELGLLIIEYKKYYGYDMNVLRKDLDAGILIEDRGIPILGTRDGRNRDNLSNAFKSRLESFGFTLVPGDSNSRELILKWKPHGS